MRSFSATLTANLYLNCSIRLHNFNKLTSNQIVMFKVQYFLDNTNLEKMKFSNFEKIMLGDLTSTISPFYTF